MKRFQLAATLLAAMALAGCGLTGGKTVVKYDKGSPIRMTEAPKTGTYGLYSTTDRTAQVTYRVEEGEKIGFRETSDGVVAVAGMHEQPIKTGMGKNTYYWKLEKK
jgi:hypothetical protein